jgi:hypothetical protein
MATGPGPGPGSLKAVIPSQADSHGASVLQDCPAAAPQTPAHDDERLGREAALGLVDCTL